jgi:hypothetical protein
MNSKSLFKEFPQFLVTCSIRKSSGHANNGQLFAARKSTIVALLRMTALGRAVL